MLFYHILHNFGFAVKYAYSQNHGFTHFKVLIRLNLINQQNMIKFYKTLMKYILIFPHVTYVCIKPI